MNEEEPGRRERKKAATRRAISDAAMELFLERGFDAVTIKEVADRADVSPATVYTHFPQKEALVYDEDDSMREGLLAAVRGRPSGTSITDALRGYFRAMIDEDIEQGHEQQRQAFEALIAATPALQVYAEQMWARHRAALAEEIAAELRRSPTDPTIRAYARFALEVMVMIDSAGDPYAQVDAVYDLLDRGWAAFERGPR